MAEFRHLNGHFLCRSGSSYKTGNPTKNFINHHYIQRITAYTKHTSENMGRIKTKLIKRVGIKLYKEQGDQFSENFGENKKKVSQFAEVQSKKLRNIIAGYVTRLSRSKKHNA